MIDPTISTECRRFEFRNGALTEVRPLVSAGGYLYQSREDFIQYWMDFDSYLRRLADGGSSEDQTCPFCSLTFSSELGGYVNPNRVHPFVDQIEVHFKLWESGVIVTSNSAGWHLVSELVIPREHVTALDSILERGHKLIQLCISRWYTHRRELSKILPVQAAQITYHGIVLNQRAGQSVTHFHYHCYTSIHPLIALSTWLEFPVIGRTVTTPSFDIRASGDDDPDLVAISVLDRFYQDELEAFEKVGTLMLSIARMFKGIQTRLYGFEIPASVGWFLLAYPKPYLIYAVIPMKRHGTIQAFQGDRFRKFRMDSVLSLVRSTFVQQADLPIQIQDGE